MTKILTALIIFLIVCFFFRTDRLSEDSKENEQRPSLLSSEIIITDSLQSLFSLTEKCFKEKQWDCAETGIRKLIKAEPNLPILYFLFGQILLEQHRFEEALTVFQEVQKQGIEDSLILSWIQKAKRLKEESEELGILRSAHFELLFENGKTLSASDELFSVLEHAYDSLCLLWNYYPENIIGVVLYEHEKYQGAHSKPQWSLAVYDGKIRIPFETFTQSTSQKVLIHELSHAFVRELAGEQAPIWLNEGIAQKLDETKVEYASLPPPPNITFLEKSFMSHTDTQTVQVLYAYSLAMTEILFEKAGSFETMKIFLQSLPSAASFEEVIENNFQTSPSQLLKEVLERRENGSL